MCTDEAPKKSFESTHDFPIAFGKVLGYSAFGPSPCLAKVGTPRFVPISGLTMPLDRAETRATAEHQNTTGRL